MALSFAVCYVRRNRPGEVRFPTPSERRGTRVLCRFNLFQRESPSRASRARSRRVCGTEKLSKPSMSHSCACIQGQLRTSPILLVVVTEFLLGRCGERKRPGLFHGARSSRSFVAHQKI